MSSFGISIVALAAVVSPGVLFIVSCFSVSIIKRTTISFGPAIDIAIFFSLSLLLNLAYGLCIGRLLLHDHLKEALETLDQLAHGSTLEGNHAAPYVEVLLLFYLTILCGMSCIAGAAAFVLAEELGFDFVHGPFTAVSESRRTGGVTICSALCNFGGTDSFVVYIGEVTKIVLDDKNSISYLSMTRVTRSLLEITKTVTELENAAIPSVSMRDQFIIPGSSLENLAFAQLSSGKTFQSYALFLGSLLVLTLPAAVSANTYFDLNRSSADTITRTFPECPDVGPAPVPMALASRAPAAPAEPLVVPVPALKLLLEWDGQNRAVHDDALRTLTASVGALEAAETRMQAQANDLATKVGMLTANLTKLAAVQAHGAGRLPRRHRAAPRQ